MLSPSHPPKHHTLSARSTIFSIHTPSHPFSLDDGSSPETAAGPPVGQLVLNLGGAPSAPLFLPTLETKFRWPSAEVQLNELNYLSDYLKLQRPNNTWYDAGQSQLS